MSASYEKLRLSGKPVRLICGLVVILCSGCQFAPSTSKLTWPWSEKKPAPQPDRVLAVWTDTILHQPNLPGVRGFGGRVYFYKEGGTDPIEANGALAVYVFDADELQAHDQRPLRKFVFTTEQFATHMSRTSLGPSYSVWLPWGEVGGPPRRLSLIARFEGAEGGTTISEPTVKLLPGVPTRQVSSEEALAKQRSSSPFQFAGHTTPGQSEDGVSTGTDSGGTANALAPRPRNIKTIDLPPSFQRHLQPSGVEPGAQPQAQSAPGLEAIPAGNSSTSLSPLPGSPATFSLTTLDAQALQALTAAEATAPPTTQVDDYRSRLQQHHQGNGHQGNGHQGNGHQGSRYQANRSQVTSRLDIREGKWIDSLPRIERLQ